MSTLRQVDFHDTGPPESIVGTQRPKKLREVIEQVGLVTNYLPSPRLTMVDVLTSLSTTELQRHIVDHFDFSDGKILIDGQMMIAKDPQINGKRHGTDNQERLAAAE